MEEDQVCCEFKAARKPAPADILSQGMFSSLVSRNAILFRLPTEHVFNWLSVFHTLCFHLLSFSILTSFLDRVNTFNANPTEAQIATPLYQFGQRIGNNKHLSPEALEAIQRDALVCMVYCPTVDEIIADARAAGETLMAPARTPGPQLPTTPPPSPLSVAPQADHQPNSPISPSSAERALGARACLRNAVNNMGALVLQLASDAEAHPEGSQQWHDVQQSSEIPMQIFNMTKDALEKLEEYLQVKLEANEAAIGLLSLTAE